jgi:hypothetical protein
MRRVKLWLREHNNFLFIKDFIDLDDPIQFPRFDNRTFSEIDKFEEGVFYTNEELQSLKEEIWNAAREIKATGEFFEDMDVVYNKWDTFADYQKSKGANNGEV